MATQLLRTRVIVIGGGFSGLATGAQLKKQLGLDDYVIYERSPEYGGTWWANRYVPSIFYSLSFAPNPDFAQLFPQQAEILAYISEETSTWSVRLSNVLTGETFVQECDVLITAVGGLVNPNPCTIPGLASFAGPVMHTAQWDPAVPIEGKNVVVLGNGCSGSQLVPAIAPIAQNVFQFARSPQFYFPRANPTIHPAVKWAFRWVPGLMLAVRWLLFHILERSFGQFYTTPRGDRQRAKEKALSDAYVEKTAPRAYWGLLKPRYKVGCKRKVYDPGYLASLHRENVHLTDDAVVQIGEREVVTASGTRYPADVIVLANGFVTGDLNINIIGRGGATTKTHWAKYGGVEAYKTTALSDFPNFFIVFGPNAASGHTSVLFSIETTIDLIIRLARPVLARHPSASAVCVKPEYEKAYSEEVQSALRDRVWADCKSFYRDATGWNFAVYPWSSYTMWWQARFPDMNAWAYTKSPAKTE
ncbi:FAD/NAD(P)-binding domain-containing protein [Athelia psychrophila]|uniref:FAD/NAD(P)-binding domain-containing protein n=1 Tax=Athelia psychrophila TaxID=1759441 RepID=A0A167UTI2_9AGAM|nr:FAD/NAD(P)-binding domain-containing protein [Fibularhizoctonia sp. CBS 109695]